MGSGIWRRGAMARMGTRMAVGGTQLSCDGDPLPKLGMQLMFSYPRGTHPREGKGRFTQEPLPWGGDGTAAVTHCSRGDPPFLGDPGVSVGAPSSPSDHPRHQ